MKGSCSRLYNINHNQLHSSDHHVLHRLSKIGLSPSLDSHDLFWKSYLHAQANVAETKDETGLFMLRLLGFLGRLLLLRIALHHVKPDPKADEGDQEDEEDHRQDHCPFPGGEELLDRFLRMQEGLPVKRRSMKR